MTCPQNVLCKEIVSDSYYVEIPTIEHDIVDIIFAISETLIECFGDMFELFINKHVDCYTMAIKSKKNVWVSDVVRCISLCASIVGDRKWVVQPSVIFGKFTQKFVVSNGIICD